MAAGRRAPGARDGDGLSDPPGGHHRLAHPTWRATSLGVYRFWRDLGYAVGALLSGLVADWVGLAAAIHVVATLTLISGVVVLVRMRETLGGRR